MKNDNIGLILQSNYIVTEALQHNLIDAKIQGLKCYNTIMEFSEDINFNQKPMLDHIKQLIIVKSGIDKHYITEILDSTKRLIRADTSKEINKDIGLSTYHAYKISKAIMYTKGLDFETVSKVFVLASMYEILFIYDLSN